MWTINQMEQLSPFGGVLEMSHREEPRSGRGCFGAVVVVPFLALGGMFALIALTGSPDEAPLAAPPPARPTSQWWTEPFEPFETGVSMSTVTETVVVEGRAREVAAARLATQTRVSTVTETVRVSGTKPPATGRNEPAGELPEEEPGEVVPSSSDSASPPVVTTSGVTAPPAPPVESPVSSAPSEPVQPPVEVPPSTPRAEDPVPVPVPPSTTTPVPPCDRAEPGAGDEESEPGAEESGPGAEEQAGVEVSVELPLASPAEDLATSSAPLAGV